MSAFDSILGAVGELTEQIVSGGGSVENVLFKPSGSGVGIFAECDLAAGSTLISVPFQMCLSVEMISQSSIGGIFEDNAGLLQYPDEVLAIALMHAVLKPDSDVAWSLHTKSLPTSFNTTLYWSEAELDELRGNMVYHLTKMMKRQIDADYLQIHQPLSEAYPHLLAGSTKELYTWALSVVYSRSLEITRKGGHVRCIVPVLDMANHNPHSGAVPHDTFEYDDNLDTISLKASAALGGGEECYAVYGIYPNAKLVYNYGFAVLNNPHRAIDMWAKPQPSSYAFEVKQAFLQSNSLTRNQTYDFQGTIRSKYISPALLATIRVIQADASEIDNLPLALKGMVSTRNEAACYLSLRSMLTSKMDLEKAMGDKTQLGKMLLDDADPSDRLLLALTVKVEERQLLEEALTMVNGWIQAIEQQGEEFSPADSLAEKRKVSEL